MNVPFNPSSSLIRIRAIVIGPVDMALLWLILDTGASHTLISADVLNNIGCDVAAATQFEQLFTANGTLQAPVVTVDLLESLGQKENSFSVLAYSIPHEYGIDGLLGLDFLRGHVLTIDFPQGRIELN